MRRVYPSRDDPMRFEEQVIAATGEGITRLHPMMRESSIIKWDTANS
jgi:hypothetical protein